jgi:pilus assembly protein CpaB
MRGGIITIGLAILCGLLGGALAYQIITGARAGDRAVPTVPVVVAAAQLPVGQELAAADLAIVDFPAAGVPDGSIRNPDELVGQVVRVPMQAGEPVLTAKLSGSGGVASRVPVNMRATSITIDDSDGIGAELEPGDRVDVISSSERPGGRGVRSRTILQNIQVLDVEHRSDQRRRRVETVVTLLVEPSQAETLATALFSGQVQLALRNPADVELVKKPVRRVSRAKPKPKPAPAPPAPTAPTPVTVIRGSAVSHELPASCGAADATSTAAGSGGTSSKNALGIDPRALTGKLGGSSD